MMIDKSNYKDFMSDDTTMNCSHRNITEIRYLPDGLVVLDSYHNQITSLPKLPNSLVRLDCENNQLTSLPKLPDSLESLFCYNNQLTSLPDLPDGLERLYCHHNRLPIDGHFYSKEAIKEFKIRLDNIIKLEEFLVD